MSYVEITGPEYTEKLLKRVSGEIPETTWLRQFRGLLLPNLRAGVTLLDVGCATGYAYRSFKRFGIDYTGLDFEEEYLKIAREWLPDVNFIKHNLTSFAIPQTAEIVICSAVIEQCSHLTPALKYLVDATERILLLRTYMGDVEHIYSIPSPIPQYRDTHRKYYNQYSFKDVLSYIEGRGFKTRVYRDEYTDSMPQFLDGVMRTIYIVYGEKNASTVKGVVKI